MIQLPIYRVRLSAVELRQLLNAYRLYVVPTIEPKDAAEGIIWQLMFELCVVFYKHAGKLRKRNSIPFAASQAMAFMAFWNGVHVSHPYEDLVIRNIIAQLDQAQISYAAITNIHLQS